MDRRIVLYFFSMTLRTFFFRGGLTLGMVGPWWFLKCDKGARLAAAVGGWSVLVSHLTGRKTYIMGSEEDIVFMFKMNQSKVATTSNKKSRSLPRSALSVLYHLFMYNISMLIQDTVQQINCH